MLRFSNSHLIRLSDTFLRFYPAGNGSPENRSVTRPERPSEHLFRFIADESDEISSGCDLRQVSRLAIDKVIHDNGVLSEVGRGKVVADDGGGRFQDRIAGGNSD